MKQKKKFKTALIERDLLLIKDEKNHWTSNDLSWWFSLYKYWIILYMVFCLSLFLVLSPSFISRLIFIVISHSFSIWLLPDSFLFSRSIYTHVFVSLIGVHKMWCEWMVGVGVSTHESGAAIRPRDPYHTVNSYGSCVCVCLYVCVWFDICISVKKTIRRAGTYPNK